MQCTARVAVFFASWIYQIQATRPLGSDANQTITLARDRNVGGSSNDTIRGGALIEQSLDEPIFDKCVACWAEMVTLGDVDANGFLDPGEWHGMFVKLMDIPIFSPKFREVNGHEAYKLAYTWRLTLVQWRKGLPNCDVTTFIAAADSVGDTDTELDMYQWQDVMELSDTLPNNLRVNRKEAVAAGLEPYSADGCTGVETKMVLEPPEGQATVDTVAGPDTAVLGQQPVTPQTQPDVRPVTPQTQPDVRPVTQTPVVVPKPKPVTPKTVPDVRPVDDANTNDQGSGEGATTISEPVIVPDTKPVTAIAGEDETNLPARGVVPKTPVVETEDICSPGINCITATSGETTELGLVGSASESAFAFKEGEGTLAKPDELKDLFQKEIDRFLKEQYKPGIRFKFCTHVGSSAGTDPRTGETSLANVRGCTDQGKDRCYKERHGFLYLRTRTRCETCLIKHRSDRIVSLVHDELRRICQSTPYVDEPYAECARQEIWAVDATYQAYVSTDRFAAIVVIPYKHGLGETQPVCSKCYCAEPKDDPKCRNADPKIDTTDCCARISCFAKKEA